MKQTTQHWTDLKPRKRIIPWGRWRVLTRLWMAESKRRRIARNEARLRTLRLMREIRQCECVERYRKL